MIKLVNDKDNEFFYMDLNLSPQVTANKLINKTEHI